MSASPAVLAAFREWKLAELATHYATPCPDALMDSLTDKENEAFHALQSITPTSADDMVLKLFPLILRDMEPKTGQPPLRPSQSRSYCYDDAFIERLCDQLGIVSSELREAIAEPHQSMMRGEAA